MDIKTLTGPSVQAALADARRLLGDDVVLLESVAASDGEPARITVALDAAPVRRPAPTPEPALAAPAYGYAGATRSALPRAEDVAASLPARSAASRSRLFTQPAPSADPVALEKTLERLLDDRLQALHDRLDALDRRQHAGGALLAAVQRWAAHPLFGELLAQGLRPETADRLFQAVVGRGFRADDHSPETLDELRWALAQELRGLLAHTAAPQRTTGPVAFVGPGGAGKTSLLLKLATHPSCYGRRRTAVLVIEPEDAEAFPTQSPAELYRRFGLAVQTARTASDVRRALDRTADFDQLLIDTPSLPVRAAQAAPFVERLHDLLDAVTPLDVHLVLDATRALDGFDAGYLAGLGLRPTAVSLTRLDETLGWGRVAEWLLALPLPVRFVSTGPRVPDGVRTYTPGWFVEELAHLAAARSWT